MTEHRMSRSREYTAWRRMKSCCLNQKFPSYRKHGAKGVQICPEWSNSFSQFLKDMGPMPPQCNGLMRIEPTVDFCPLNCIWEEKRIGKPISGKPKKSKHHKCKNSLDDPKTITLTLERDHVAFIKSQALQRSIASGSYMSVPQLIREALQKAFPAPKQFDMFGDKRA